MASSSNTTRFFRRPIDSSIFDAVESIDLQGPTTPNLNMNTSPEGTKNFTMTDGVEGIISPGGTRKFVDPTGSGGSITPGGTRGYFNLPEGSASTIDALASAVGGPLSQPRDTKKNTAPKSKKVTFNIASDDMKNDSTITESGLRSAVAKSNEEQTAQPEEDLEDEFIQPEASSKSKKKRSRKSKKKVAIDSASKDMSNDASNEMNLDPTVDMRTTRSTSMNQPAIPLDDEDEFLLGQSEASSKPKKKRSRKSKNKGKSIAIPEDMNIDSTANERVTRSTVDKSKFQPSVQSEDDGEADLLSKQFASSSISKKANGSTSVPRMKITLNNNLFNLTNGKAFQNPVKKLNYTYKDIINPILAKEPGQWGALAKAAVNKLPMGAGRNLLIKELQAASTERANSQVAIAKAIKAGAPLDSEVNPHWQRFRIMKVAEVLEVYPQYVDQLKVQAKIWTSNAELDGLRAFYDEIVEDPKSVLLGLESEVAKEEAKQAEEDEKNGGREEGVWTMRESLSMMDWCFEHHHEALCRLYLEYATLPVLAVVAELVGGEEDVEMEG